MLPGNAEDLSNLGVVVILGLVVVNQLANVVKLRQMVVVPLLVGILQVLLNDFCWVLVISEFL